MRAPLDIADDVLQAARERARREQRTAGEVVSGARQPKAVHGFKPFARRGNIVTNDIIDQLRTHDAY